MSDPESGYSIGFLSIELHTTKTKDLDEAVRPGRAWEDTRDRDIKKGQVIKKQG